MHAERAGQRATGAQVWGAGSGPHSLRAGIGLRNMVPRNHPRPSCRSVPRQAAPRPALPAPPRPAPRASDLVGPESPITTKRRPRTLNRTPVKERLIGQPSPSFPKFPPWAPTHPLFLLSLSSSSAAQAAEEEDTRKAEKSRARSGHRRRRTAGSHHVDV